MEQETEKKETKVLEKLKEETDKSMKRVLEQGVQTNNVDFLYKMIDIKKDIAEIEKEEQEMMYGNYGNYGRDSDMMYSGGRRRDSRGRYMEGGSYGRRDVPGSGRGRYRESDPMEEMMEHYNNYNESKDMYNESGNYNAKEDSKQSLHKMLKSAEEFFGAIVEQADSPEEIKMVKETAHKISMM